MNQLCRVCGEPAAGFHFGAFTCEGCKSFFGRTYNNTSSISECKNNGECVINKKNRTSCKACRLRKCLMVGMSKSGSRYGRRSNWFKIHCLLQEQQQQQQQAGNNPALREPLNTKNSKMLPLWEGLAPHFHDTKQQLHLPSAVDVDNNNTGTPKNFLDSKSRSLQSGHLLPVRTLAGTPHPGYAGEAAAALWAARNSLLPLQVTSHHHATSIPPLPVPFLTSPFLHSTGFHHPHHGGPPSSRNFLLPFVQSMATSPKHHVSERLASPATSSSTSTPSSSHSPSPIRDGKVVQNAADVTKPEQRFGHSEEPRSAAYEKSVALLQSLGPVQDQPIDLSVRSGPHNKTIKHRRRKSSSEDTPEEEGEVGGGSDGGVESCDDDRGEEGENEPLKERGGDSENRKPISTPLDLTTKT
ncbi:hypothetical protein B7P43_G05023 [Cryptotermes secundus]|uniref:Nuclear receptor domain-containing protein n=2 Tax=Cryptotermes secundus TaxID=105785 RepID=A0A2J7PQT7_9NEOP|nr:zygotic gap protein knirps isoform X2 [Cryptotermes secundus]XP_023722040.1 zygotic gap protein knirps isoform X2 [Cryptotermes secundus]XP_023722041.1 zygotic gap protein knirps isoform X2 [Cryptotermes secundus]PNF18666.1 hypothetical protein B7P43_G05023 [Cryptotermes secundus]